MAAKHILVFLHVYQLKIVDDLEPAFRALYSDVLPSDEKILIQVEKKWGDRQYFVHVQDRSIHQKCVAGFMFASGKCVLHTAQVS